MLNKILMRRILETKTGNKIKYQFTQSHRAQNLRLTVNCDRVVVLTAPFGFDFQRAEEFLLSKIDWVLEKLDFFKSHKPSILSKYSKKEYKKYRIQALALAKQKVCELNQFYFFKYNRISVKNQKTRWGSCSKKRNLNFNYKIVFLPENLLNYLVVHELCHLKEMNHGKKFWDLVAQKIPNFLNNKKALKSFKI